MYNQEQITRILEYILCWMDVENESEVKLDIERCIDSCLSYVGSVEKLPLRAERSLAKELVDYYKNKDSLGLTQIKEGDTTLVYDEPYKSTSLLDNMKTVLYPYRRVKI